jgi:UDP-N-acetylmuramoylalanine--D-glutamate ligase
VNCVSYYNDSKATSVDATQKAIDTFAGGLWIILGGKDKGAPYQPLRDPLHHKAHAALLIGTAAQKISGDLNGYVPVVQCGTLETAVGYAHQHAAPGDTVLLAPACASFDQFRSYEHRGEVFKELVNRLSMEEK